MPKVYNKRDKNVPADAIYVGRPSVFGNPFAMREHTKANRDKVCDAFENMCSLNPKFRERIKQELRGKDLVCWCAPARCHADTLLRIANEEIDNAT